jgi:hypothetical protein
MVDLHQEFQNSRFFHQERIDERSAEALIGISAGLTADGVINVREAEFLKSWMETHMGHLDDPVINILYRRLSDMLSDGVLDLNESAELLHMLQQFSGVPLSGPTPFAAPSSLPLCSPTPLITWPEKVFMITGVMAYGPRKACEGLIEERGGLIGGGVSKKVHYLVIGSIANEQWLHSSYGLKIKKAVQLRENGHPISIISEEHWQKAIFG